MAIKRYEEQEEKDDSLDLYERARSLAEKLPAKDAYDALKKIKKRYPKNSSLDLFLFNVLEKLGMHDNARESLQSALNSWESLREDALDRLADTYCANVIKDPTKDYVAEGLLAPSKFVENAVRRRLRARLAANPRDTEALRWMGALSSGAESVFYLRLAAESDKNEVFARRRLLKHFAERIAYAIQDLPTRWNGDFEADTALLDYCEKLLLDVELCDAEEGRYWRSVFDSFNVAVRDYSTRRKRKK